MSVGDRVLQLVELLLLCLCLVIAEVESMRSKNLEKQFIAETSALRYELKECEERCRRLSYTCIDVVNRKILEGGDYDRD